MLYCDINYLEVKYEMPSKLHQKCVEKFEKQFSNENNRILRISRGIRPDLIVFGKEGLIAVEIALSWAGVDRIKKNLQKYACFDKVVIFRVKKINKDIKSKRYLPKEIHDFILLLSKEGYSQPRIIAEVENEFKRTICQSCVSYIQRGQRKCYFKPKGIKFEKIVFRTKS